MTDKLPNTPALPVSLLRKKFNRSISGRKRKHRLYNPDQREIFMGSPEKSSDEIDNCEEEYNSKPTEERRTVLYVTNVEEFFTGVDEKSTNEILPLAEPSHRRSLRLRQRKDLLIH